MLWEAISANEGRASLGRGQVMELWLCFAGTIPTAKCSRRSTTATSACTAPGRTPSALPPVPAAGDSSWARWDVRAPPASYRYQPPPQCPPQAPVGWGKGLVSDSTVAVLTARVDMAPLATHQWPLAPVCAGN